MKHISYKVLSCLLGLAFLFMAGIWVFQIAFFETSYVNAKTRELEDKALVLAELIESGEGYGAYMSGIQSSHNISVLVTDAYEFPIYASRGLTGALMLDTLNGASRVAGGDVIRDYILDERTDIRYVRVGVPVSGGGALFLAQPVADVSETVAILQDQFLVLTLILLVTSVLLSLFLANRITKPILRIEKQALAMASGDLQTPITPITQDEVGRLALTMENLRSSLSQVDRLGKELIANVSHELRTPLSIIRGFAETVRDITWRDEKKREYQLNAIVEESVRLERLVSDILDYSQLQAGKLPMLSQRLDLGDLAGRTANRMRDFYEKGGLKLECAVTEAYIVGDGAKLEQLIVNLLSNAFNHTPMGKKVTVRVKAGSCAVLEIEDEGEGIAQGDLPYIWNRYYKTTLRTREDRMGTGLGLAICKTILDNHGAKYTVASSKGVGTKFIIEFPLQS